MFHLKLFAFFVLGLMTLSLGAPVIQHQARGEGELFSRGNAMKQAVAIARQMKRKLNHFKPGEVLFHSGHKPAESAKKGKPVFVKQDAVKFGKPKGQKILSHHLVKNKIWIPNRNQNKYSSRLWRFASKIVAQRAKGPTSVVVGERLEGNIYDNVEKPALMKNPNVPRLTEHNLVTGKAEVVKGK